MIDERRLQLALDRSEIFDLIAQSIVSRDSGLWDELAECYHSQAELNSSWWSGDPSNFIPAAKAKLEAARAAGGEQKHMTSNYWIEINGDVAVAECDLILYMRSHVRGVELDLNTFSRRLHLLQREGGNWKIVRRFAIYEKDQISAASPNDELAILPAQADLNELLSNLVFEGCWSCGDLVEFGFNSVFEFDACDDFGEVVKAA